MYIVLANPLAGPVQLQTVIDNSNSDKVIALREITYTASWMNISKALNNNVFMLRKVEVEESIEIPDGYYNIELFEKQINKKNKNFKLEYDEATGYITVTIALFRGAFNFLNMAEIFGGSQGWFGPGTYICPRVNKFYSHKALFVHLDQLNTSDNIFANESEGTNSTLLRIVPTNDDEMGQLTTVTYNNPQYRKLCSGHINELTISILDNLGKTINFNNNYNIFITLEVK